MYTSNSKNINQGDINSGGGDVHLGDNYYKSIEYKDLQKQISRLEKLIQLTKDEEEKALLYKELEEEINKLDQFKQGVISLAETFQKIEVDTERLKSAKQFFDEGKFKEARAILETEKIENDQHKLLERKSNLEKDTEENKVDLRHNADEYLVLAKLTAIDFNLSDRFEKTITYFESSLKSNRNENNLFSYAYFLQEHNQNNKAIPLYEETLAIYQKSAKVNPQTSYNEALTIGRELTESNPEIYLPEVGMTLTNLAFLQSVKKEFEKAESSYEEALSIYRKLAEANSQIYLPYLAQTQINMSIYFLTSKIDKNKSLQLVDEAITSLLPFQEIPYIQNYLKVAYNVLKEWGIDVDQYLAKKQLDEKK